MIILSKLADYGVIVAAHLASHPERMMTAGTLAQETRLPRATVAKVLKTLAHAGIVAGSRGAGGGYRLARAASSVSLAEVVAAIDGAIGVAQCSVHAHSCERSEFCPTRPHWRRINEIIGTALSAVTLAEMALAPRAFTAEPAARAAETRAP
ncbi:MAG TPA: SUF system Fe-S cluster assembly regulator [Stellaceae bacterium]|nr:SUF system Fe-S cluster assembly regulator [Stellaceae bacterium]